VSILSINGKQATAGLPCIYQLMTGQFFYSETAKDDDVSYIFDGDQTLVLVVTMKGKGQADIQMLKVSQSEFSPKQLRVPKSAILMVTDCGRPELVAKAKEALSGIVLAGPGSVN
jgi:hypothetical protein